MIHCDNTICLESIIMIIGLLCLKWWNTESYTSNHNKNENGNEECVKETTTWPKCRKQSKVTMYTRGVLQLAPKQKKCTSSVIMDSILNPEIYKSSKIKCHTRLSKTWNRCKNVVGLNMFFWNLNPRTLSLANEEEKQTHSNTHSKNKVERGQSQNQNR